jgi:hypothetical protein
MLICNGRTFFQSTKEPHFLQSEPSYYPAALLNGVARWFIFKPKIPIWLNYGGLWYGKCWYVFR